MPRTRDTQILVRLRGSTARLRQLVKEHGNVWMELDRRGVACFSGRVGVLVESLNKAHCRWVELTELEE